MKTTNISTLRQNLDQLAASRNKINYKKKKKNKQLALNLVKKFHSNNIAIITLITTGLTEECFSLQRLSLEHFFNIFALMEDGNFIDKFKNNTEHNLQKVAKELKKSSVGLTQVNSQKLERLNNELNENPIESLGYNIYDAAKRCPHDILSLYDSVYRIHSITYAHSTIISAAKNPTQKEINGIIISAINFSKILNKYISSINGEADT